MLYVFIIFHVSSSLQHYSLLVCAHEMTVKQLAGFGALPKNSLDAAQHPELADENSAEALPGKATSRVRAPFTY